MGIKNNDIVDCWRRSRQSQNKSMRSDGSNLFSYNLKIGYTDSKGKKVALDYTASSGNFRTRTTSNHVSLAKEVSNIVETPS